MDSEHINAPPDAAKHVEKAADLFNEHGAFIRATLGYFIKDADEQEELYQDLFVYFVRKPVPADVQNVRSWLYRTVLDRIRDQKRRQSRYCKRVQVYARDRRDRLRQSETPAPDKDEMAAVFELIKKHLPEAQSHAVLYKYQHQLEVEEIARRMKVKSRTVSRYLAVGLRKLRTLLNKDSEK